MIWPRSRQEAVKSPEVAPEEGEDEFKKKPQLCHADGRGDAGARESLVPSDTKPVLEIEEVTKRYRGSMALDGVSFTLEPGVFGLLGPNGAGKTTLIKALMGLVRISSGEARVLGLDSKRDFRRVRELVGYMPEDDCIFPGLKGVESVAC